MSSLRIVIPIRRDKSIKTSSTIAMKAAKQRIMVSVKSSVFSTLALILANMTSSRTKPTVNTSEYKRNQFCPIIRVSCKAFGIGRRMPIVAKYLS